MENQRLDDIKEERKRESRVIHETKANISIIIEITHDKTNDVDKLKQKRVSET